MPAYSRGWPGMRGAVVYRVVVPSFFHRLAAAARRKQKTAPGSRMRKLPLPLQRWTARAPLACPSFSTGFSRTRGTSFQIEERPCSFGRESDRPGVLARTIVPSPLSITFPNWKELEASPAAMNIKSVSSRPHQTTETKNRDAAAPGWNILSPARFIRSAVGAPSTRPPPARRALKKRVCWHEGEVFKRLGRKI